MQHPGVSNIFCGSGSFWQTRALVFTTCDFPPKTTLLVYPHSHQDMKLFTCLALLALTTQSASANRATDVVDAAFSTLTAGKIEEWKAVWFCRLSFWMRLPPQLSRIFKTRITHCVTLCATTAFLRGFQNRTYSFIAQLKKKHTAASLPSFSVAVLKVSCCKTV